MTTTTAATTAAPEARAAVPVPANPPLAPAGAPTLFEDALAHPFDVDNAVERLARLQRFFAQVMHEGEDYGPPFPGSSAIALLRPGADKLCQFFGVYARPRVLQQLEQWGLAAGEKVFFLREYEVDLISYRTGQVVAIGNGSANSMETKWRWRKANRACPACNAEAILRSKFPDRQTGDKGWYCNENKGGCGAQFTANDPQIRDQAAGRVENTDLQDLHHTIIRVAKKRGKVDAVVSITRAAGFMVEAGDDEDTDDDDASGGGGGAPREEARGADVVTQEEAAQLGAAFEKAGHKWDDVRAWVKDQFNVDLTRQRLPKVHFTEVLERLASPEKLEPF